ncbi:MAG: hypothetical protein H6555_00410 [Lewinellaceae bacterium]|nr:hypothetical protein [Lewinellaceae bacterium]
MLHFWRRIKRKLIDEGNLKGYLLYAIGEIFLVVIGILIAIQINGWNENRKSRDQEAAILIELSRNITANVGIIRQTMQQDSASVVAIENLFRALENKVAYSDTLASYFAQAIASYPTNLSNSTMETIRAKGVDIIQSERIRNKVLNLFDIDYAQIREIYDTDQQSYNNVEQVYLLKNFRITRGAAIPNDFTFLRDDPELQNILAMRNLYRGASLSIKSNAIRKSHELIQEIDAYLVE